MLTIECVLKEYVLETLFIYNYVKRHIILKNNHIVLWFMHLTII